MPSEYGRSNDDGLDRRLLARNGNESFAEVIDGSAFASQIKRLSIQMPVVTILPRNFLTADTPTDFIFEQLTSTVRTLGRRAGLTIEVVGPPHYKTINEKDHEIVAPLLLISHTFLIEGGATLVFKYFEHLSKYIASKWGSKKAALTDAACELIVTSNGEAKRVAYRGPVSGLPTIVNIARVTFDESDDVR